MPRKDTGDERPGREQKEHARHERESDEREPREREEREHGDRDDDGPPGGERREGEHEPPRRRRMGREHAVHQQIVERRLGGGAPATPEAYAKGLEEWHKLPGSVVRPPSDEKSGTESKPKTPPENEGEDKENRK